MAAAQPVWSTIADRLIDEIRGGQRRPGDKLPTEAELSSRFGVNRHTVRRALAAMADQGLVHARRGAGVFVTAPPLDYPIGRRTRFSQNLAALGHQAGRSILSLETRHAGIDEAEALHLPPDAEVHVAEGISTADDQPIALYRSVFPAARFPDLPQALRDHNSITAALRAVGVADYTRAETRLNAKLASAAIAGHLRIRAGEPVLRIISVNIDAGGVPVEYGRTWMPGDRITLTIRPD